MSLSFGLNIKPKASPSSTRPAPSKAPKPTIFDDSDSEPESRPALPASESITTFAPSTNGPSHTTAARSGGPSRSTKPSRPPPRQAPDRSSDLSDLSGTRASLLHSASAATLDPSIYDYDTFHASKSLVESRRQAAAKQDALERKPKYVAALLSAAAQRKQDAELAKEKALRREREAEGDEFAGAETFVTEAYKRQREENARVEEAERVKREAEEKKRTGPGGLAAFHRGVLGEQERVFEEKRVEAERAIRDGVGLGDAEGEGKEKDDEVEEARRRGVDVLVNEEGEVADKRQLLSAGLNVGKGAVGGGGAEHLRSDTGRTRENVFRPVVQKGDLRSARERQTRLMEEQLEARTKRKADEEAEEARRLEHAAKSKKTEGEVLSAKERYLARKKEREEAAKRGG